MPEVALFMLARHIEHTVRMSLDALAAAQAKYRAGNASYASDIAQLPANPDAVSMRGVRARIVAASADGFLAEGRHDSWAGKCLIALGSYAGDSLKAGEPRCYSP
jgi:hypothetical protein